MTTTNESLTETKRKTITLDEETYKRLGKVGTFGESFDNLINRILDEREGKKSK
jgi:predicted CopG family antitoxin